MSSDLRGLGPHNKPLPPLMTANETRAIGLLHTRGFMLLCKLK